MSYGPIIEQNKEVNRPHADVRPGTTTDLDPRRNTISPPPEEDRDRTLRNQADLARKVAGEGIEHATSAARYAPPSVGGTSTGSSAGSSLTEIAQATSAAVRERLVGVGDQATVSSIEQQAIAAAVNQARDLAPRSPHGETPLGPVDERLNFAGFQSPGRVSSFPLTETPQRHNRAA